jgi:hypothetical protein
MVHAARILAALTLLTGGTEGASPAWMVAGVIASLQRRYLSGCVFLLHTANKADLSKRFAPSVAVSKSRYTVNCSLLIKTTSERFLESVDWSW